MSFSLDDSGFENLVRIRIFPYNNDVSLRVWEAGTCLSEFFIENPDLLAGKGIIELGSGCGLTGLAVAARCKPWFIHLTDFTEACQLNLEHNLQLNQKWLSRYNYPSERISSGHLEWETFAKEYLPRPKSSNDTLQENDVAVFTDTLKAFSQAHVLIAADVVYDVSVIDHLVNVVRCFLRDSGKSNQVIFAITKRNKATFELFFDLLQECDITCKWIVKGEDCVAQKNIFECNLVQPFSDVQIFCFELIQID